MRTKIILLGILLTILMSGIAGNQNSVIGQNDTTQNISANQDPIFASLEKIGVLPRAPDGLNASAETDRNITIYTSASILVTDTVLLTFIGDSAPISIINYTVPNLFAQYIVNYAFYVALNKTEDNALGGTLGEKYFTYKLRTSENYRSATMLKHVNYTFYSFYLNQTHPDQSYYEGNIVIRAYFWLENAIKTYFDEKEKQRIGYVNESILPLITGVSITNGTAVTHLESDGDVNYNRATTSRENMTDRYVYYGRIENDGKTLSVPNRTREAFDPSQPLTFNDTVTYFFKSSAPEIASGPGVASYKYSKIIREVYIDAWGSIRVVERFTLVNTGFPPGEDVLNNKPKTYALSKLQLVVPDTATPIDVYDAMGPLNPQQREDKTKYPTASLSEYDGYKTINLGLRYPLYGGDTYEFTFEYTFKISDHMNSTGNKRILFMPLSSWFNVTVEFFEMNIHLPSGSAMLDHTIRPRSLVSQILVDYDVERQPLSITRNRAVQVLGYNLTSTDNQVFTLEYKFNRIYYLSPIANWTVVIFLILLAYALVRQFEVSAERVIVVEQEVIPVEEIKVFLKDFGEKDGIQKRQAQLRKRLKSGQIKKRAYDEQRKKLETRLRQVNQRLEKSANALKKQGQYYRNTVEKIMIADQRRTDMVRNLEDLERKYRLRQVPKDLYQRLTHEYTKELRSTESTINKELSALRLLVERE